MSHLEFLGVSVSEAFRAGLLSVASWKSFEENGRFVGDITVFQADPVVLVDGLASHEKDDLVNDVGIGQTHL